MANQTLSTNQPQAQTDENKLDSDYFNLSNKDDNDDQPVIVSKVAGRHPEYGLGFTIASEGKLFYLEEVHVIEGSPTVSSEGCSYRVMTGSEVDSSGAPKVDEAIAYTDIHRVRQAGSSIDQLLAGVVLSDLPSSQNESVSGCIVVFGDDEPLKSFVSASEDFNETPPTAYNSGLDGEDAYQVGMTIPCTVRVVDQQHIVSFNGKEMTLEALNQSLAQQMAVAIERNDNVVTLVQKPSQPTHNANFKSASISGDVVASINALPVSNDEDKRIFQELPEGLQNYGVFGFDAKGILNKQLNRFSEEDANKHGYSTAIVYNVWDLLKTYKKYNDEKLEVFDASDDGIQGINNKADETTNSTATSADARDTTVTATNDKLSLIKKDIEDILDQLDGTELSEQEREACLSVADQLQNGYDQLLLITNNRLDEINKAVNSSSPDNDSHDYIISVQNKILTQLSFIHDSTASVLDAVKAASNDEVKASFLYLASPKKTVPDSIDAKEAELDELTEEVVEDVNQIIAEDVKQGFSDEDSVKPVKDPELKKISTGLDKMSQGAGIFKEGLKEGLDELKTEMIDTLKQWRANVSSKEWRSKVSSDVKQWLKTQAHTAGKAIANAMNKLIDKALDTKVVRGTMMVLNAFEKAVSAIRASIKTACDFIANLPERASNVKHSALKASAVLSDKLKKLKQAIFAKPNVAEPGHLKAEQIRELKRNVVVGVCIERDKKNKAGLGKRLDLDKASIGLENITANKLQAIRDGENVFSVNQKHYDSMGKDKAFRSQDSVSSIALGIITLQKQIGIEKPVKNLNDAAKVLKTSLDAVRLNNPDNKINEKLLNDTLALVFKYDVFNKHKDRYELDAKAQKFMGKAPQKGTITANAHAETVQKAFSGKIKSMKDGDVSFPVSFDAKQVRDKPEQIGLNWHDKSDPLTNSGVVHKPGVAPEVPKNATMTIMIAKGERILTVSANGQTNQYTSKLGVLERQNLTNGKSYNISKPQKPVDGKAYRGEIINTTRDGVLMAVPGQGCIKFPAEVFAKAPKLGAAEIRLDRKNDRLDITRLHPKDLKKDQANAKSHRA